MSDYSIGILLFSGAFLISNAIVIIKYFKQKRIMDESRSADIVNELITDFKSILFPTISEDELTKENNEIIIKSCLLFCNQIIAKCTHNYIPIYVKSIEILNNKLKNL